MPWKAAVQAIVVILLLLLLLLLLAAQAVWIAHIRCWVRRLEREKGELSRTIATVQGWTEQQFRAVRGELTISRVNDSAAEVMPQRAEKRLAFAVSSPEPNDDLEEQRDTVATPAPVTPAPMPSDEDGEATTFFKPDPPMYAARSTLMRPPALLAPPDLIGSEDIADEAAFPNLGPEENTPPRHGRAAIHVPVFHAPEEESA